MEKFWISIRRYNSGGRKFFNTNMCKKITLIYQPWKALNFHTNYTSRQSFVFCFACSQSRYQTVKSFHPYIGETVEPFELLQNDHTNILYRVTLFHIVKSNKVEWHHILLEHSINRCNMLDFVCVLNSTF